MSDPMTRLVEAVAPQHDATARADNPGVDQDERYGPEPKQHGTGPESYDAALEMLAARYAKQ
jgi:hypothetical protein